MQEKKKQWKQKKGRGEKATRNKHKKPTHTLQEKSSITNGLQSVSATQKIKQRRITQTNGRKTHKY